MGTSGTVNNAFLAGLLGGVGNQMMTHEERQYQQKLSELKLKREVLAALSSDQTASPQAQALALQGLLSSPDQPKAKGIRGKLGQREGQSQLDEIISKIKAMPAQTLPAKPPIQVPAIPSAPQQSQAATGKPMSEAPPIQVPGMPGSPPLTPPNLGMMGTPPQLPQQLPGMPEVPGLKADPSQIIDPALARIRLQHELGRQDLAFSEGKLEEGGVPQPYRAEMLYGQLIPAGRASAKWTVEAGPEGLPIGIRDPEGKLHTREDPSVPSDVAAEYDARIAAHETQRAEKAEDTEKQDIRSTRRLLTGISAREEVKERDMIRKRVAMYTDATHRLKIMEDAAAHPSPQNDVALTFNHIGMTLSAQRGARVTQAEIQRAIDARSLPQELQVLWDKVSTGQFLAPEQRAEMVRLAHRVELQTYEDIQNEAEDLGVPVNKVAPGIRPPSSTPSMPQMENPYRPAKQ